MVERTARGEEDGQDTITANNNAASNDAAPPAAGPPLELWRPLLLLLGVGLVMNFVMFVVEGNPKLAGQGFDQVPTSELPESSSGILDTGFVVTRVAHRFLEASPLANDLFALCNSILVLSLFAWCIYLTLWVGDFGLVFRVLFCQLLRGVSGYVRCCWSNNVHNGMA